MEIKVFRRDWSEKLKKDDNGAKKMEQAIKDLIAEFEERLKEYRFNELIYNGVDRVLHEYWTGMKIATYNALVELNKLLEV